MKDFVLALLFTAAIVALVIVCFIDAINSPVVQVSNSTGKCTYFVQADGERQEISDSTDCSELLKKYKREWVK